LLAKDKILITGAAGFIGANLAKRLLDDGFAVVGYDNLSYGTERNLRAFAGHPDFQFIKGDVRDTDDLEVAIRGVSQVVHLAAYKIPRYSDALDTLLINGAGSIPLLELARKYRVRVIAASTADVYGKSPDLPFREDGNLVIGESRIKRWAYAVSKLYEEHLLLAFRDRYNLPIVIVRFFGGYGPLMNLGWWGGPIAVFIRAALDRTPLPIHGDGTQTRCFTYIDDYVDGIVAILKRQATDGEIINIGSTDEIAMKDLAARIWKMVNGDEPLLRYVPYESFGRYEDCKRRQPDLSVASRLLDYSPKINLGTGLRLTCEWVRNETLLRKPVDDEGAVTDAVRTLYFIVPVYNEAANIPKLLVQLSGAADAVGFEKRFVFVDDGSDDGTAAVLNAAAATYPITVLPHSRNLGVAAAFNTGFAFLLKEMKNEDLIVSLEGDNTSDPEVLPRMVHAVGDGADIVLASCYHHNGSIVNVRWWRLLLSHIANGTMKTVFSLNAIATLSSFYRVYRAGTLKKVQDAFGEPILVSRGFECMIELLAKINYCGLRIDEVPMVLDGSKRIGRSKMKVLKTIFGYLTLACRRYCTPTFKKKIDPRT